MAARAWARLAAIGTLLILYLPCHHVERRLTGRSRWPRRFLGATARIAGVRLAIVGTPARGPSLIVGNHRSWLDIPVMAAASGCAFVSKAEVRGWPLVGRLAALNDTIFIERGRRSGARDQADTLRAALRRGKPVALFPEGTTHAGPGLLPFRASLFAAVDPPDAGVVVQPALIDYGAARPFVAWPDEERAFANLLRILGRRGTMPVTVRFLDPIDSATRPGRKAIAAAAQAALEAAARIG